MTRIRSEAEKAEREKNVAVKRVEELENEVKSVEKRVEEVKEEEEGRWGGVVKEKEEKCKQLEEDIVRTLKDSEILKTQMQEEVEKKLVCVF